MLWRREASWQDCWKRHADKNAAIMSITTITMTMTATVAAMIMITSIITMTMTAIVAVMITIMSTIIMTMMTSVAVAAMTTTTITKDTIMQMMYYKLGLGECRRDEEGRSAEDSG